jgi:hypothetical protein
MTERTARDWIDDIERMQGGPNGPTIRLRACVLEMEAAEEGSKEAFGVVVQEKHDALAECQRLRELLTGAHAQIRSFYLGTPEVRLAAALKERDWLRHDAMRALVAWDGTVLPKARDGLMQERMESLRAALADLGA